MGIGTIISNVLTGRANRAVYEVKSEVASDIKGAVRGAIDPGTIPQQQQGAYGVQPRQPGGQQMDGGLQRSQMRELPVARQPGFGGGGGQPATLGDAVGGWMARLVNSVAPAPGGITDRITRGAVTEATVATGNALRGAPNVPLNQAPAAAVAAVAAAVSAPPVRAAEPPSVVETFPVSMPSASDVRTLPPLPSTPAATTTAPAALDTKTPAISTAVSPKEDFKEAASPVASTPVALAVQAPAAEFHSRFDAETNARAQAFLNQNRPGTGPA